MIDLMEGAIAPAPNRPQFGGRPAQVHVPIIFVSLAFSIIVGVVFGLYPAWRASRLDPIEALRHD